MNKNISNKMSLSGASSEPIISAEPKENQPRYSVNCQAIPKYDLLLASPKDSLHRHPERSEGSIKNNIKDWILRFANAPLRMTIPVLALLFSFNLSPSFAADSGCDCGDDCCWEFDSSTGKLTITGSGAMNDYDAPQWDNDIVGYDEEFEDYYKAVPWVSHLKAITSVDIGDGITSVGGGTFMGYGNLKSVTGMNDVKTIGNEAFTGASSLTDITLPDSVTSIGGYAFSNVGLSSIDLPDSVTYVDGDAFWNVPQVIISDTLAETIGNWSSYAFDTENPITFLCKGDVEKCKSTLSEYQFLDIDAPSCPAQDKDSSATCMLWPGYTISEVSESQCTGNYGWNGASCARKDENGNIVCASGYADYKNKCWAELPFSKKHWTPAEAAEWLNENNNTVTITFKK